MLLDDDAVRVAAVGDAAGVLVREVVGEDHVVAEVLVTLLALRAGAVRVHHAAHSGQVAGLEPGHRRAHLRHAAHNLMAGNARVNGGHQLVPLVPHLVQVRVTDSAEKNLNLDVVRCRIAPRDRSGGKRRFSTGSGIGFCVRHGYS